MTGNTSTANHAAHELGKVICLLSGRAPFDYSHALPQLEAAVDAVIAASVRQMAEDGARQAQARREVEALDLEDFAQQPAEDATQEDSAAAQSAPCLRAARLAVHASAVDADTVNVIVTDAEDKQAYAAFTVSADSDTINVYAAGSREVHIMRYEDYYGQPAQAAADADYEAHGL